MSFSVLLALSLELVSKLPSQIPESSGLIAGNSNPPVLWTHNDSGNSSRLYALSLRGKLLGVVSVDRALNLDWEDIARDDKGNLLIYDSIGVIYRVVEPSPYAKSIRISESIFVHHRKGEYCEAMFVFKGNIYLIGKRNQSPLYVLENNHILKFLFYLPIRNISGADISRDGKMLAVVTPKELAIFRFDGELSRLKDSQPLTLKLPSHSFEGICFAEKYLYLSSEGGELYRLLLPESVTLTTPPITPRHSPSHESAP